MEAHLSLGILVLVLYALLIGFVLYVLWSVLQTLRSMDRTMSELARRLRGQS